MRNVSQRFTIAVDLSCGSDTPVSVCLFDALLPSIVTTSADCDDKPCFTASFSTPAIPRDSLLLEVGGSVHHSRITTRHFPGKTESFPHHRSPFRSQRWSSHVLAFCFFRVIANIGVLLRRLREEVWDSPCPPFVLKWVA